MSEIYSKQVQKIRQLGEPEYLENWPNYLEYGFNNTHIQELIGLLSGKDLWSDGKSKEDWGGVHAWRVLGQLKATEAIEPLYDFLRRNDDDWSHTEIPQALDMIGLPVLETSINVLKTPSEDFELKIVASEAITLIARTYPQYRKDAIFILGEEFKKYKTNDISLNAVLILELVKLQSYDYLKEMEDAFEAMCVDEMLMGDWGDVQAEFRRYRRKKDLNKCIKTDH